jgi:hypothetical protein
MDQHQNLYHGRAERTTPPPPKPHDFDERRERYFENKRD